MDLNEPKNIFYTFREDRFVELLRDPQSMNKNRNMGKLSEELFSNDDLNDLKAFLKRLGENSNKNLSQEKNK